MDRTERFFRIERLLRGQHAVPLQRFVELLEVSPATVKRDIEYLRDRFGAPIIWDRDKGGYRLDESSATASRFALPGLWFNASELHALLTMRHLLGGIEPGVLNEHIDVVRDKIDSLLGGSGAIVKEVEQRIRVLQVASRSSCPTQFRTVNTAVLTRRRLRIVHFNRRRNDTATRDVSPQRLVHYRDNWYLDAWCHSRRALRSFALDAVSKAELLPAKAKDLLDSHLDEELGAGYGIFAGASTQTARLKFSPERARWVASEAWHPQQRGQFHKDGSYVLEVPFSDERELLMDVMRHGPHVEVLGPRSLRDAMVRLLAESLGNYGTDG